MRFYYLNSRYYDPHTCRFISADSYVSTGQGFIGNNMYAYCNNNPIAFCDKSGYMSEGISTQSVVSFVTYLGAVVASFFDQGVREDMNSINWNPFNTDESQVLDSSKISFYKGTPVFKTDMNRSGSFCAIFLESSSTETTLKHEYGHSVQQMLLGPMKYAAMIFLPSWQEWSSKDYYDRPWEITADIFGGVTEREHSQEDVNRGFAYLATSKGLGALGYLFLIEEY